MVVYNQLRSKCPLDSQTKDLKLRKDSSEKINDVLKGFTELSNSYNRLFDALDKTFRYQLKLNEPQYFEGKEEYDEEYDIEDFLSQFDRFCSFNEVEEEDKCNVFTSFLGREPLRFFDSLDADEKTDFHKLRQSFISEYSPPIEKYVRKLKFFKRKIKDNQTVGQFYREIKSEAIKLNKGDESAMHVFTGGLTINIKEYVVLNVQITLEEAYKFALAKESAMQCISKKCRSDSIN